MAGIDEVVHVDEIRDAAKVNEEVLLAQIQAQWNLNPEFILSKHCREDQSSDRVSLCAIAKPLMGRAHNSDLFIKLLTKA